MILNKFLHFSKKANSLRAKKRPLGGRSLTIGGPTNFLPDLPDKIVTSSAYNKSIPIIIGSTKDDGSYIAGGKLLLTIV